MREGKVKRRFKESSFSELTVCYCLAGRHESSDNDGHVPVGGADWIASRCAGHGSSAGRGPAKRPRTRAANQQITFLRVSHYLLFCLYNPPQNLCTNLYISKFSKDHMINHSLICVLSLDFFNSVYNVPIQIIIWDIEPPTSSFP